MGEEAFHCRPVDSERTRQETNKVHSAALTSSMQWRSRASHALLEVEEGWLEPSKLAILALAALSCPRMVLNSMEQCAKIAEREVTGPSRSCERVRPNPPPSALRPLSQFHKFFARKQASCKHSIRLALE